MLGVFFFLFRYLLDSARRSSHECTRRFRSAKIDVTSHLEPAFSALECRSIRVASTISRMLAPFGRHRDGVSRGKGGVILMLHYLSLIQMSF